MAILGKIRNKTGNTLIVVVVCILVAMLVGSDIGRMVTYLFGGSKDEIGTVAGKSISYADYQKRYAAVLYRNFDSQGKQPTIEEQRYWKNYAWNQLVSDLLYAREVKEVGIMVGSQELVDLVQGDHIDSSLMAAFKDPKTATFDKKRLLDYLGNLSPEQQKGWCQFEQELAFKRNREKLHLLMMQSAFTTTLERTHAERQAKSVCDLDYIYIPFSTVSNALVVPPTKKEMEEYITSHPALYTTLNSRTIKYIAFSLQPDEQDNANFQKEISTISFQFSAASDPYAFAQEQTDGNLAHVRLTCGIDRLPPALAEMQQSLQKGIIVGPVVQAGMHTLYRVVDIVKNEDNIYQYQLAVIQKKVTLRDETRNKHFKQAQAFAEKIRNVAAFDALAQEQKLNVQQETIYPSTVSVGSYVAARQVVRWLYNQAKVGKVSQLFDVGEAYLVAVMIDETKADGLVPLRRVQHKIYDKLVNERKGKIIVDTLKQIPCTDLEDIAAQYGHAVRVVSVDALPFGKNQEQLQLQAAKKFIGHCFALPPGKSSIPIVDENGVFIARIKKVYDQELETTTAQTSLESIAHWMQYYYVNSSMEELAQVADKRYRVE